MHIATEHTPPERAPVRAFLREHRVALIASVLVTAGFVWVLHQGALPVLPDQTAQANLHPGVVVVYALSFLLVLTLRAVRWHWLLAPVHRVDWRRILVVNFLFFAASVTLPFRLAEAVRPALIREKDKLSAWAIMGSVAAERVVDGLCASLLLLASLAFAVPLDPLPDKIGGLPVPAALVPKAAYSAVGLFVALFVTLLIFYLWRNWARRTTLVTIGVVSPKFATWLADKIDHLADGLRFLPQLRYSVPFLLATVSYWALHVIGTWMLMRAAGLGGLEVAQAAAVVGVLALGMLVPNAPGFFGTFQISVYAGLAMYRPGADVIGPGSVAVFWLFVVQIGLCLACGLVALVFELRMRKRG
ncbi:MAG TPA: lysylphosphatidylglycerol synthase transmembrane domain-containing protein [Polyangiaceae bacterium]|nr:lysylphosphatidylglycerol synthase transmembrane domain-containing protein [Polyangiaceae bacterium]